MIKRIDYYEILQVHPKAEKDVIEAAYKKLASLNHEAVNQGSSSEEKTRKINLAYEVLMDERRREIFHEDWLNHSKEQGEAERMLRLRGNKHASMEDLKALDCAVRYFDCLERKDYKAAYQNIATYEKAFLREQDFVAWQEANAKVIEIGDIQIREFKKHINFESRPGWRHQEAYEFEVSLSEMHHRKRKISENHFSQMVIKEEGRYGILVGYDNLRPLINKCNLLADIEEDKDAIDRFQELETKYDAQTGLLNKKGFLEESQKEAIRFKRYGRMFSILCIDCISSENLMEKEEVLHFIVGVMKKHTRALDLSARWNEKEFMLLLPETDRTGAEKVAEKLKKLLNTKEFYVGREIFGLQIETGVSEFNSHSMMETIYRAQVKKNIHKIGDGSVQNAI